MYKKSAVLLLSCFYLACPFLAAFGPLQTPPSSVQAGGTTPTKETAFPQSTLPAGNVPVCTGPDADRCGACRPPAAPAATSTKQPKVVATAKPTKTKRPTAEQSPPKIPHRSSPT